MADNTRGGSTDGASPLIATDEVTYSGDTADVQLVRVVGVSGAEGSKTVDDIDTTVGLKVTDGSADYDDGSADGNPDTQIGATVHAYPRVFNGTTWDRMRGDTEGLFVKLRDESGSPLVTGVQYIEDSAITADLGQGTLVVGRRDNALSTLTPAEGDAVGLRVGATGALWTQPEGNVANDDVDAGNPIKIGGKGVTNPAGVADGDRVDAWFDTSGALIVGLEDVGTGGQGGPYFAVSTADAQTAAQFDGLVTASFGRVFNGTTWDRLRGDTGGLYAQIRQGGNTAQVNASGQLRTFSDAQIIGGVSSEYADVTGVGAASALNVGGNVAHDAADSGNPLKIGGKAGTSINPTAVATSDRVDAHFDTKGRLGVFIASSYDGTGAVTGNTPSDGFTATAGLNTQSMGSVFNGTTWDRMRSGGVTGMQGISGDTAHDSADSGNPVKIGGKSNNSAPTAVTADNERVDAWMDRRGALNVATAVGTGSQAADGSSAAPLSVYVTGAAATMSTLAYPYVYNGTNWDRLRGTTNGLQAQGAAAHASPVAGNPVFIAGRASTAIPTDVGADGDAAGLWTNRNGAPVQTQAPHVGLNSDPWNLVHEGAQYTSAQTSTVLVAGGASEKIVVTKVQIQAYSTTAGTAILYFGTGAYSRGTNRAVFDGEFAPSSTLKPGVVLDGPFIAGTNGDDLMVTTTNALSITFSVWFYVIV